MSPVNCPKCSHKIADKIVETGLFKVSFIEKGRGRDQIMFMLPVTVSCRKCLKKFSIVKPLGKALICGCKANTRIAEPYTQKRRSGDWISVNLSLARASVECSDALLQCRNKDCDTRMFLSEFTNNGKILSSTDEENSAWIDWQDKGMIIRGIDNPPQEVIDATI